MPLQWCTPRGALGTDMVVKSPPPIDKDPLKVIIWLNLLFSFLLFELMMQLNTKQLYSRIRMRFINQRWELFLRAILLGETCDTNWVCGWYLHQELSLYEYICTSNSSKGGGASLNWMSSSPAENLHIFCPALGKVPISEG